MKHIIYLSGSISIKFKETYDWRKRFREYFQDKRYDLEIIDPCDTIWNQDIIEETYKTEPYLMKGVGVLPTKDYNIVKYSTIVICNTMQYDPDKMPLGTFFELAWAFAEKKTVIGIYDGDANALLRKHPFIDQSVNSWVKNEQQAARLVERFFV